MFRNTGLAPWDVQAMFNASPNAYVVLDRDLVIAGANGAYLKVTGRASADIVGRNLFDAFPSPPDSIHGRQLRQSLARVLATRLPDHIAAIRYPITAPDGTLGEHVWSATHIPVCAADGSVSHILQHTENITHLEQLRAQARANDPQLAANILRRAEASQATIASLSTEVELLRSIFEQAPGFTVVLRGPQHVFEMVNTAYLDLVGQRELLGRTVREALPELAHQGFFELLDQVYTTGEAHVGRHARVELRTRPGQPLQTRHVDFVFQPVRQADGQVRGIFVQGYDLTPQVTAEQQAQTSQRRFETLAHTLPLHVWTARADGAVQWCNDQVLEYLGFDPEQARATDWMEIVHPDDRAHTLAAWQRCVAAGDAYLNEFRLRRHDGEYRWHLSRATPLRDAQGTIAQWVGSNTDIHEQKASAALQADLNNLLARRVDERTAELVRTQEALRHSQQLEAIGSLAGGIAHEFNNLLQVIGGNLQLMAQDLAAAGTQGERLNRALTAVQRGADLSRQLLSYGRRQPLQPEVIDLGQLIQGLEDLLRKTLGGGVEVLTVVDPQLWPTMVDAANLESALLNLALNARDAMDGRGRLTIEASNAVLEASDHPAFSELVPGEYVLIAVSDNGHGMDPEVQARAFEPFFTTKPRGKGSGLGLSMVFGFAKQSGGHVKLYSEVGHGTTLRLYLPRSLVAAPVHAPMRGSDGDAVPVRHTGMRVLVVEDDAAVRDTVVNMLDHLGHEVVSARDASAAMTLVESGLPIDLLFTDVVMPGPLSSTDLAERARRIRPGLRVLFTSGYTEKALLHGGRLDDAVQLLSKPYSREALQRKIDQVLGDAAPASDAATESGDRSPAPSTDVMPGAEPPPTPLASPPGRSTPHVLICEDDELVRESLMELLNGMGCTVTGCATSSAARAALAQHSPDLLITDLSLPDGNGLDLARHARHGSAGMAIAVASGRGSREAAAQVPGAVALDKPFSFDDLVDLLDRLPGRAR